MKNAVGQCAAQTGQKPQLKQTSETFTEHKSARRSDP
jgi:hypothetical protein